MESIGRLAGGVAHDFNNLLMVMFNYLELAQRRLDADNPAKSHLTQVFKAAERAAGLTRQLLAFARKQVIHPRVLCPREVVANIEPMLRRMIGEDLTLRTVLDPQTGNVLADASQLEQVLMNLAVNARDAMPDGGQLTISTGTGAVREDEENKHPDARPGPYVFLAVTDTGCGIAPEHIPHIFEPFFTTKEIGKGSGLGLATIYGIVAQHDGWISITTKKERGTTFRICFPEFKAPPSVERPANSGHALPRGTETILVAEDDPTVRLVVGGILARCGYKVIEAVSGVEALDIWKSRGNEVDLLLTDMVMPDGVTGRELAEKLLADKPGLKVIYSSGYSPEVAGGELPLKEGINFLQKPYNPRQLAQIVRQCIDRS
jgi:CheY-like chemotaxis protein